MTTTTCPECSGRKGGHGFIDPPPRGVPGPHWIPCTLCGATGVVPPDVVEAYCRGREVRNERLRLKVGLRAGAWALGLTPTELSSVERGRAPPPDDWRDRLARGTAG